MKKYIITWAFTLICSLGFSQASIAENHKLPERISAFLKEMRKPYTTCTVEIEEAPSSKANIKIPTKYAAVATSGSDFYRFIVVRPMILKLPTGETKNEIVKKELQITPDSVRNIDHYSKHVVINKRTSDRLPAVPSDFGVNPIQMAISSDFIPHVIDSSSTYTVENLNNQTVIRATATMPTDTQVTSQLTLIFDKSTLDELLSEYRVEAFTGRGNEYYTLSWKFEDWQVADGHNRPRKMIMESNFYDTKPDSATQPLKHIIKEYTIKSISFDRPNHELYDWTFPSDYRTAKAQN